MFDRVLNDHGLDPAVKGRILKLPTEQQLAFDQSTIDVDGLHLARRGFATDTIRRYGKQLRAVYDELSPDAEVPEKDGVRLLRNLSLWYLMKAPSDGDLEACRRQAMSESLFDNAWAANRALVDMGGMERERALAATFERWKWLPALLDHWFMLQAASEADDCVEMTSRLRDHSEFSLTNAPRLKAILDTFTGNQHAFHDARGDGYECVIDTVLALNEPNPRLAARFLKKFDGMARFDPHRQRQISSCLNRVLVTPGLARDLREVVEKCLAPQIDGKK
jgi:aminopeptidase N